MRKFRLPRAVVQKTKDYGQATTSLSVVDRNTQEVLHEKATNQAAPADSGPPLPGISGISFGLTIPGPKNTYMVGRIDVHVALPHGASDEEAREALARSEALVEEKIGPLAEEVYAFFDSMKGR